MTLTSAEPLTPEQLDQVQHLVGYDLWPAWVALGYPGAALELAYAQSGGDLALVAAYALQAVCDAERQKAAELASAVKRVKVGALEVEKELGSQRAAAQRADTACARATALRDSVRVASVSANPAPILEGWGLGE